MIQAFAAIGKNIYVIPGFSFTVNQKCKNKIYRIPVLPLARFRSKKQKETETRIKKDSGKPGSSSQGLAEK